MNRTDDTTPPLSLDQAEETRIRRALGLHGTGTHQQRPEQARQRHRFVSDGAVPVVMLNRGDSETSGLKDKLIAAESAVESERAAHVQTKRSLQEAQAAYQALQTQFAHAKIAHKEALEAEQNARRAAEEALAALKAAPKEEVVEPQAAEPKRRGRRPVVAKAPRAAKEQKPVRWWTPTYRSKTKR